MSHSHEAAGVILGFDGRGAPGGTDIDHAIQVALESQAFVGPISTRLDIFVTYLPWEAQCVF